jgi:DNA-binding transcriptional MerR regulator
MYEKERQFTVGEISQATGMTVRTLQHYDNIGLLPVSGRSEGGRRYYTEKDLLKLEQIVFYKSIGIPLKHIKEKLTGTQSLPALQKTLEEHLILLVQKADAIHLAISVAESTLEVVSSGNYPPWEMMANLIQLMDGSSLINWSNYNFDNNLLNILKEHNIGNTLTNSTEIYHEMRQIMITAITLRETCQKPDAPAAQSLAKRWWEMIMSLTGGEEATISAFANVNKNREAWPESDRKLYEAAEPFLEAALGVYIASNDIEIPNSFLEKE